MAKLANKRAQNVDGDFFVDDSCIDCGTCYWMAPKTFAERDGQSAVIKQPQNVSDKQKALQAVLSCPTFSIGAQNQAHPLQEAAQTFPIPIRENVFHTGFHSEKSFGATSYFIQRPEGNVLIDSPRFYKPLVKRLEDLGGIRYQYLTHRDDVADTDLYWQHFQSERILHKDDASQKTKHYEILLDSKDAFDLAADLKIISVPGHTKGSTVLLHNDFLFTGDHLAWSQSMNHLYAFKTACWYDFDVQIKSMEKLLDFDFLQILPGHGTPYYAKSFSHMKQQLKLCLQWMKS